jgi:DNA modification methylase
MRDPTSRPAHDLVIETKSVATLLPDPKNARLHPERHIKQLAKSIEAFGFNCPLLIDHENRVIAGHGRLLAVKHLGWQEVPTIRLEHLTPEQMRAFAIADNRLSDISVWDDRLLAENLKALSEADLDFDLEVIGFDLPEIDLRIQSLGDLSDEPADESDSSVAAGPAVSVVGDVWQLGPHRIVCGSALEPATYEALLGSGRAAMVFTDPPYNVPIAGHVSGKGSIQHREFAMASGEMSQAAFTDFLSQALAGMKGACTSGALLYVCMDWRHLEELTAAGNAQQLELKNLCVWDKGCGGMGSLYRSQHELVFVYKAGAGTHTNNVQLGKFGRNRTNVWTYPGVNSFARETGEGNLLALHPTVKPVALVADALLDASERGDLVLDPFLGSGTTVIAAEKTGRIGMGIELDPHYIDTAVRRWQRLTGKAAVHALTGQSFDAAATERSADADRLSGQPEPAYAEEGA